MIRTTVSSGSGGRPIGTTSTADAGHRIGKLGDRHGKQVTFLGNLDPPD